MINRKWNYLSKSDELWRIFSLTDIQKPKWCPSKLVSIENTNYLISNRFSPFITRVDLAKLCFSFDTLDTLFQHCQSIKSLCINFKYLQIKAPNKYLVDQCIHSWPINRLEKLYLKNVCDMKTRRFNTNCLKTNNYLNAARSSQNPSYDIIELEIIKLIRILFRRNSTSLRVLGLKCVDPNIISSCLNDFDNLEILLLNNINDTDSVLQELAYVCKNLKCLELNKCMEFKGDGLQEILDQCLNLQTLQLGKQIYPTVCELKEINWSNLKCNLKELSITTKFPTKTKEKLGDSSSSDTSLTYSSTPLLKQTLSSNSLSIDVYSKTLFNYLNESNNLEYLALEDFTLKFSSYDDNNVNDNYDLDNDNDDEDDHYLNKHVNKKIKIDDKVSNHLTCSNLKYLYLRNIRNVKHLTDYQLNNLKMFLNFKYNLQILDLIGLYLDSKFLCKIIQNLNNLRVFNFGHGKSYKKSFSSYKSIRDQYEYDKKEFKLSNFNDCLINIDEINLELAENCKLLTNLGIFYRQSELEFKKDNLIECKNEALMNLLNSCVHMKTISYLKSFKIQDDDDDGEDEDDKELNNDLDSNYEENDEDDLYVNRKRFNNNNFKKKKKPKSYFHFIKYAIQNTSVKSTHVNMQPCYGFDITPSSGHLLDINNYEFIETSLPRIQTPVNDFHVNFLK